MDIDKPQIAVHTKVKKLLNFRLTLLDKNGDASGILFLNSAAQVKYLIFFVFLYVPTHTLLIWFSLTWEIA